MDRGGVRAPDMLFWLLSGVGEWLAGGAERPRVEHLFE
jgi:hypothetical protein